MSSFFSSIFGQSNKAPRVTPTKEVGVSGSQVYGGYIQDREKSTKLTYLQRNQNYDDIVKNIAVVAAGVRYFTDLATSAKWTVEPSEDDTSGEYAEIVEKILFEKLETSWSTVVGNALGYRWYGFSALEWTMRKDDDGLISYKTIEQRPQRTIEQWQLDDDGKVIGFGQVAPMTGQTLLIPRSKTLYLVDDTLSDSPAGLGVLRQVFESCERLKNYMDLEKQGFEKDLRNIPIGLIPYSKLNEAVATGEITQEQMNTAITAMEDMVKTARKQSSTGLTIDSMPYISQTDTAQNVSSHLQWDLKLLEGSADSLDDIAKAIERLQHEIARVLGTEGLLLQGSGSNAMAKEKNQALYLGINSALTKVQEQANKDLIDPLWSYNGWDDAVKPKLGVEDINQIDALDVSTVLSNMATAGAPLSPGDEVINDVRTMIGVSEADLDEAIASLSEEEVI